MPVSAPLTEIDDSACPPDDGRGSGTSDRGGGRGNAADDSPPGWWGRGAVFDRDRHSAPAKGCITDIGGGAPGLLPSIGVAAMDLLLGANGHGVFLFFAEVDIDRLFASLDVPLALLLEKVSTLDHRESKRVARIRASEERPHDVTIDYEDLRPKLERLGFEVKSIGPRARRWTATERSHDVWDEALGDWRLHVQWYAPRQRAMFRELVLRLAGIGRRITYFRSLDAWQGPELDPVIVGLEELQELAPASEDMARYELDLPANIVPLRR